MYTFNFHLNFCVTWRKVHVTFFDNGAKDTLAANPEMNYMKYNRPCKGYDFVMYIKHHKATYQATLSLQENNDYIVNDPKMIFYHFLNGKMKCC